MRLGPVFVYNRSMNDISSKLHISTIDECAGELARRYGVGVEIAVFCWAQAFDEERETHIKTAREFARGVSSLWFHAPFAELSPCAIDPKVRALTRERYLEALAAARELGINRLVVHGGYIPRVYYPEYFVSESIRFWKDLLVSVPSDTVIALENVMDPDPSMLVEIADGVGDERLGLCLDIGHANCDISRTPPADWIRPMAKHLKHVHLHNNHGENDLHLPLGEGVIDCESIINEIVGLVPEATFTIENMHAVDSVNWLIKKGFIHDRL